MPEMEDSRPHLELRREAPVVERRTRRGFSGGSPPDDPRQHGAMLGERLQAAREMAETDIGGYDARRLIKITLTDKIQPEQVAQASAGVDIVSQEEDTLLLAFATEQQLEDFEAKLAGLAAGEGVTYQNVIYALQDLDHWSPEDRAGWALRRDGLPDTEFFAIDVELWPLTRGNHMDRMRRAFETWVDEQDGEVLDAVRQPYLTIYPMFIMLCTNILIFSGLRRLRSACGTTNASWQSYTMVLRMPPGSGSTPKAS